MQRYATYFRQQADFCFTAAKIATTSSMAADFERLARLAQDGRRFGAKPNFP
jgi:hypothetical protein